MIEFLLYLIGLIANIDNALSIIMFLCAVLAIITGVSYLYSSGSDELIEKSKLILGRLLKIFLVCLVIAIFLPSQKTMYMIFGSHYLKQSNLPNKVELLINKKLDEFIVASELKIRKSIEDKK